MDDPEIEDGTWTMRVRESKHGGWSTMVLESWVTDARFRRARFDLVDGPTVYVPGPQLRQVVATTQRRSKLLCPLRFDLERGTINGQPIDFQLAQAASNSQTTTVTRFFDWLPGRNPDAIFRKSVRREFGALARECGTTLKQVEPMVFGFCTRFAVLTIGAYPGHFRSICVKIRAREAGEDVGVRNGVDIGLGTLDELLNGTCSPVHTKRQRWQADEIEEEVAGLASLTAKIAMSLLTTPSGDWSSFRAFVDEKVRSRPNP